MLPLPRHRRNLKIVDVRRFAPSGMEQVLSVSMISLELVYSGG